MSRKVLIYGGTGGIGSEIARLLQSHEMMSIWLAATLKKKQDLTVTWRSSFHWRRCHREKPSTRSWKRSASSDGLVYAIGSINLGSLRSLALMIHQGLSTQCDGCGSAVKPIDTAEKRRR